jgi:hypothetical protein
LRFLGIILRVLRLEVSVHNVYITNQFQSTFAQGDGGLKSVVDFCPNYVQEFGLWTDNAVLAIETNVVAY